MSAVQIIERPRTLPVPARSPNTRSTSTTHEHARCQHLPACPAADAVDRTAARVLAAHWEQGWSLLCNGVVSFDDGGALLPDGRAVAAPAAGPGPLG